MASVSRFLQTVCSWGLLGAVVMTLIAPTVSRWFITAPISFGVNCEPAAHWSQEALIKSQGIGLVLGVVFGLGVGIYLRSRQKDRLAEPTPRSTVGS